MKKKERLMGINNSEGLPYRIVYDWGEEDRMEFACDNNDVPLEFDSVENAFEWWRNHCSLAKIYIVIIAGIGINNSYTPSGTSDTVKRM